MNDRNISTLSSPPSTIDASDTSSQRFYAAPGRPQGGVEQTAVSASTRADVVWVYFSGTTAAAGRGGQKGQARSTWSNQPARLWMTPIGDGQEVSDEIHSPIAPESRCGSRWEYLSVQEKSIGRYRRSGTMKHLGCFFLRG